MSSILSDQNAFVLRLLFDQDLRDRFAADREGTLAAEGLDPAAAHAFAKVDPRGLALDADGRRSYLMAALCRPYPITAAAIGASPGGARRLSAFLASRAMFRSLAERTRAFGSYLGGLLEENAFGAPPETIELIRVFLDLEVARAQNAAGIREAVENGQPPPAPGSYSNNAIKRARIAVPPHFVAAELPVPSTVVTAALAHATAENAWQLVQGGALTFERLNSVARSESMPVTALCRGVVGGRAVERAGAGGVSSIIDVSHLYVELTGRRSWMLAHFDGTRTMSDLSPRHQDLARSLLQSGFLVLLG